MFVCGLGTRRASVVTYVQRRGGSCSSTTLRSTVVAGAAALDDIAAIRWTSRGPPRARRGENGGPTTTIAEFVTGDCGGAAGRGCLGGWCCRRGA